MDGGRPAAARPAHRVGLVLDVPGRRAARRPTVDDCDQVPSTLVRDRILTRYLPLVTDALDEIVAPGLRRRRGRRPRARSTTDRADRDLGRRSTTLGDGDRSTTAARHRPDGTGMSSTRPGSTRATRSRRSSRARPTSSPSPPRCASPRRPARSLQPAVHLRLGRPRQDPPAARHRPLRAPQLPAPRGALRLDRDVHERVRRRHPHQHDAPFKRRYRDIDVLLIDDIQFLEARKGSRRSSSTRSTRCTAPTSRS